MVVLAPPFYAGLTGLLVCCTCAKKSPLMSMGGRAEGLACGADPGARNPIVVSENFIIIFVLLLHYRNRRGVEFTFAVK